MEEQNSISEVLVASPEQCLILLSPTYRPLIKKLMTQPVTLSRLAQELDMRLDSVYYRVRKLEQMGLVLVTKQKARQGKPLKYYAMTAKSYELPFSHTTSATLEELLVGQMLERQEQFGKYLMDILTSTPMKVGHEEPSFLIEMRDGVLLIDLKGTPAFDDDSTIIFWRPIQLRRKDAGDYFKELAAITEKYSQMGTPDERVEHLLGIQVIRKP